MTPDITRTIVLTPGTEALRLRRYALELKGESSAFSSRRLTIGSHPENDLVLRDASVSRFHARLEVDARGYRVLDLQSKNGTFIGDARIAEGWIEPGQTLQIGGVKLRFSLLDDEVEVPVSTSNRFGRLRGRSERMREVFAMLERVAPSDITVLVEGESGTGKELVAEALHEASSRKSAPLVVFDCSAVSPDLIESELFGHVKGAYTGASNARAGAFEQAQGGTLFIDELGELSLELQPKLLRALEQRQIRRVGGNEIIPIDVRIIAATNRKLKRLVEEGNFREDLYWRLNVISIELPPLRERPEDIGLLVEHFVKGISRAQGIAELNVSFQTMEKLKAYHWPGNVRELRNFVERAALLAAGGEVDARWLPESTPERVRPQPSADPEDWLQAAGVNLELPFKDAKNVLVDTFERTYWTRMLDAHHGNLSASARAAGVHRKTVEYIVRKLSLREIESDDE